MATNPSQADSFAYWLGRLQELKRQQEAIGRQVEAEEERRRRNDDGTTVDNDRV